MAVVQIPSTAERSDAAEADPQSDLAQIKMPPADSSLDAETDVEVLRTIPPAFLIDSPERANWLVRKVIEARRYASRVKEWVEQEQRRAEREEKTLMFLFGRQLEMWAKDEIEKSKGRRKSINLPGGVVGFVKVNPVLRVDDEEAVLQWAKENCGTAVLTVTTTKLVRNELKVHFEKTGEIPETGAHVDPGGQKFFVREGAKESNVIDHLNGKER